MITYLEEEKRANKLGTKKTWNWNKWNWANKNDFQRTWSNFSEETWFKEKNKENRECFNNSWRIEDIEIYRWKSATWSLDLKSRKHGCVAVNEAKYFVYVFNCFSVNLNRFKILTKKIFFF